MKESPFNEYEKRLGILEEVKKLGVDPYPHQYKPSHKFEKIFFEYATEMSSFEQAKEEKTDNVCVAGRLVLQRPMGKNIFAQIQEEGKKLQVLFHKGYTEVLGLVKGEISSHKFLEKKIDLGDILGIEGPIFRTRKGELTVLAKQVTLLCKSLQPIPDKYSGLINKETRYRKRWIDLIANKEVVDTFRLRSFIVTFIRSYFSKEGFMEVETPILEKVYGGAQAKPFKTHLNVLHMDMFLRIALEISLKKLIVGGFLKVYEIGKLFRNEGFDATHNPEFTSLECYAAYWDYNDVMCFMERLYVDLAKEIFGSTKIGKRWDRKGNLHQIDLKTPWIRISMIDSIRFYAGISVEKMDEGKMQKLLLGTEKISLEDLQKMPRGVLIAKIFELFVEEHLIQPHFITDYPIETTPLCKPHRNPKLAKEGIVERFEGFILGSEICNAYTELNDPILQKKLLEDQERLFKEGDAEATPFDEEFLEAICQGMPPCGGFGIGLDRLVMLFANEKSIRDVIYFPLMKKG